MEASSSPSPGNFGPQSVEISHMAPTNLQHSPAPSLVTRDTVGLFPSRGLTKNLVQMVQKESSHQQNTLEAARTFTLFPRLSPEIRLKIWRMHLELGREILLRGYYMEHSQGTRALDDLELQAFDPRCRQSALLHVNFESRTEALKLYKAFGAGDITAGSSGIKSNVTSTEKLLSTATEAVVECTAPKSFYNPTADTIIIDGSYPRSWYPRPNTTSPRYPTTQMFQEIESLVYINLVWVRGMGFAEAIAVRAQEVDSRVSHREYSRVVQWRNFRKLKHLVVWGLTCTRTEEYFKQKGKDATDEIKRGLEEEFEKLKMEDPSRSIPEITLQVKFSKYFPGFFKYAGENTLDYGYWRNGSGDWRNEQGEKVTKLGERID
ncbi:hypothetical protein HYALB_00004666 [Hymenoscyphus albidus]|uniref:2EXR domain-containing protein n=1 Tax=Hymenoscyphus albidus TaxID=595503 RepID=A0A9N9LUH6_9HELO|nr:hypothetical protein HYALB_00004666 [Hymenoscyphus albidus]